MPRTRRVIQAQSMYETIYRARCGLPFPPNHTNNAIISGIYGRAMRYDEVVLCNFVHMNNHSHDHVIPLDPAALSVMYKEVQKQCTEALKALLGQEQLNLWKGRPMMAIVPTLDDVIERLVYIFCNPVKAGLVESIDSYPGPTSWKAFKTCEPSVDATVSIKVRAYHKAAIPRLPEGVALTPEEDRRMLDLLERSDEAFEHELQIKPLAWLGLFGITEPHRIARIRDRVVKMVYEQEATIRLRRTVPPIGADRLRSQMYMKPHTPEQQPEGRKPFVLCSDPTLRMEIIAFVKAIANKCKQLYELARQKIAVEWPPGIFVPGLRPVAFAVRSILSG